MNFNDLFKKRQNLYNKRILKYLKFVLNDTFILAFLLLMGAFGFFYSSFVETLPANNYLIGAVISLILTLVIFIGQVKLLTEEADTVYLLPKETDYAKEIKRMTVKSFLFHGVGQVFATLIAMPALVAMEFLVFSDWIFLLVVLLGLKWIHLHLFVLGLEKNRESFRKSSTWIFFIISFGLIFTTTVLNTFLGIILTLVVTIVSIIIFVLKKEGDTSLDFSYMVETENRRVQRVYRFFNMFTDVPQIENKAKRMNWLDPLYNLNRGKNESAQFYYIKRLFIRDTSFSGLFIRLFIIAAVLMSLIANPILLTVISLLFHYMIVFQLIPLKSELDKVVQFKFQPTGDFAKNLAVKKLVTHLSVLITLSFTFISMIHGFIPTVYTALSNLVFTFLFCFAYLPKRLRKNS